MRYARFALLGLLALGALVLAPVPAAHAFAVFTVDSTGDGSDSNPGDGVCDDGAGNCTLRAAIEEANHANNPGLDTINFNITGGGPHTISPGSALPTITDPVIIDGTSEPDFAGTPIIELDGSGAGVEFVDGLNITAGDSTVKGLVINRFSDDAIELSTNGGNVIEGNYIGTDVTGTVDLGSAEDGVNIVDAPNNTIGGATAGAGNVISGNGGSGVYIIWSGATGNTVEGNYIGTDVTGTAHLGNTDSGVAVNEGASNNTIGGTTAAARNVICGNWQGVWIGGAATGNQVVGNYIGTDAIGTPDLGNGANGVVVNDATSNTIGGTAPGAGNVISGNYLGGVWLAYPGATGNQVQGNFILGHWSAGVAAIWNASNNTIGGTAAGAGNVISGNGMAGVTICAGCTHNQVQGNVISGNDMGGVYIWGYDNTIGGTATGAGNTIAFNGGDGVYVESGTGNLIGPNSIHSNTGLGIDLNPDGVTPNDTGDPDTGANNVQNFPVLSSAVVYGGNTTIKGDLNSTTSTTFTLEFFSNATCDPSGNGEGETFLGSTTETTDGTGNKGFSVSFGTTVPAGHFITATATDPDGNTSEFSECEEVFLDSDGDGFTDADENSIGTDPNLACGVAAWPPDFDDSTWVDIYDVNILKPAFFSSAPGPPYDVRFDLVPDTWIDIYDVNRLKPFFYLSCTP